MGTRKNAKIKIPTITDSEIVTSTPPDAIAPPALSPNAVPGIGDGLGLTVAKRDLKLAIGRFATVVDRKSTMPILANVSLRVDHTGLTITGTDLNVSLRVRVEGATCKVARTGAVSIPAKRLADIVKSLPDGEIQLYQTTKTSLTLAIGTAAMSIDGISDRDTPAWPVLKGEDTCTWTPVAVEPFTDALESVQHAICKDETRFHLNGTLVEIAAGTMRAVATDGHRLATSVAELGDLARDLRVASALIPRKGCVEICKLVSTKTAPHASLLVTLTHVWIRQGDATLAVKLIAATFPPYEQVIPKDHRRLVTVDSKTLAESVARAKVNCSETRGVLLSLASGKLTVSAEMPGEAECKEQIDAEYSCDPCSMGVNPKYLLDALALIDGRVVLALGEPGKNGILDPMLVRSLDNATQRPIMGATFLSVVMPMRI